MNKVRKQDGLPQIAATAIKHNSKRKYKPTGYEFIISVCIIIKCSILHYKGFVAGMVFLMY